MGIIIGIVNQKGGVGKTTTAINVAAGLGALGKKTLVVDFDPQGNTTTGFGVKKKTLDLTAYDVVTGRCRPQDAVLETRYKNISILPSSAKLCDAEGALNAMQQKNLQLRKAILPLRESYDVIIIDNLPSLGVLAVNGLAACDTIIVPMVCEHFAREGLAQLMYTVKNVKQRYNNSLNIMGIVFTMVDKRLLSGSEIKNDIKNSFDKKVVFKTEIPRNVKISEAQSHGEPIIYYDKRSAGAEAYVKLSKEIITKIREMEKVNGTKK